MAWYPARGGGIPASVKTDMNAVLNKKFGTVGETYPPKEWADDVNLLGLLPIRTASGTIAHLEDGADDVPCVSVVANIVPVQSGTGTPSPSNPRPISGTDELTLTQQGANLFDYSTLQTGYRVIWGSGADYADASASKSDYILVKEGARIRFSDSVYVLGYDTEKTYLGAYINSTVGWLKQSGSLVVDMIIPKGTAYIKIMDFGSISGTITSAFVVNYGATQSTDTTYRTARSYTKDLGQTVYSGSLNLVSGLLTITHRFQALDALSWAKNGSTITFYSENLTGLQGETDDFYCSCYLPTINGGYNGQNGKTSIKSSGDTSRIWVADNSYSTSADFKASLTGQTAVLKLSTPIEVQLTPEEVNTFYGVNNFWADTGDTEVEYRADIDLLLASLEGNRGLQMTRSASPVEEEQTEEVEENEDER